MIIIDGSQGEGGGQKALRQQRLQLFNPDISYTGTRIIAGRATIIEKLLEGTRVRVFGPYADAKHPHKPAIGHAECRDVVVIYSRKGCRALDSRKLPTPKPSRRRGRETRFSRPMRKQPSRYISLASVRGSSTEICRVSAVKSP